MTNGVEEEAAAFVRTDRFPGLDRFRTFGAEGPLYEVLDASTDRLTIRVVESGETLGYSAAAAAADPRA
ncbi:hypothetical protein [Brevundimonas balnearis]|uniref:Uncharacterized protein n=1 Tax=Brevundimonas balnearis TaxID=1572858 RepID=A0ABV6R2R2_9CAUL